MYKIIWFWIRIIQINVFTYAFLQNLQVLVVVVFKLIFLYRNRFLVHYFTHFLFVVQKQNQSALNVTACYSDESILRDNMIHF